MAKIGNKGEWNSRRSSYVSLLEVVVGYWGKSAKSKCVRIDSVVEKVFENLYKIEIFGGIFLHYS